MGRAEPKPDSPTLGMGHLHEGSNQLVGPAVLAWE